MIVPQDIPQSGAWWLPALGPWWMAATRLPWKNGVHETWRRDQVFCLSYVCSSFSYQHFYSICLYWLTPRQITYCSVVRGRCSRAGRRSLNGWALLETPGHISIGVSSGHRAPVAPPAPWIIDCLDSLTRLLLGVLLILIYRYVRTLLVLSATGYDTLIFFLWSVLLPHICTISFTKVCLLSIGNKHQSNVYTSDQDIKDILYRLAKHPPPLFATLFATPYPYRNNGSPHHTYTALVGKHSTGPTNVMMAIAFHDN